MRKIILTLVAAFFIAVPAYCYEFHLLNGMVIRGELTGFDGGRFYVRTDVGRTSVEVGSLDYIIVEEKDGKSAVSGAPGTTPGMPVDGPGYEEGREPVGPKGEAQPPAAPAPPAPLSGHSVRRPEPPEGGVLILPEGRVHYPGIFRGVGQ